MTADRATARKTRSYAFRQALRRHPWKARKEKLMALVSPIYFREEDAEGNVSFGVVSHQFREDTLISRGCAGMRFASLIVDGNLISETDVCAIHLRVSGDVIIWDNLTVNGDISVSGRIVLLSPFVNPLSLVPRLMVAGTIFVGRPHNSYIGRDKLFNTTVIR